MQVFKFGGASVKDAESVNNVYQIISNYSSEKLIVVISAMAKTTNALEMVCQSYFQQKNDTHLLVEKIKADHQQIIDDLFGNESTETLDEIENLFVELDWILEEEPHADYNFVYDQIVSIGELISTKIVCNYLKLKGVKAKWIDARSYIQTDNNYKEAKVDWQQSAVLMQKELPQLVDEYVLVTQGFIGGTSENFTTTLGREGSDYSAAIFASCLDASSVTIWKDVPGVLNADPKLFNNTVKYDDLPYAEALEMTFYGATVIHPKTIKPLQNKNIPLYVKPFLAFTENGTAIGKLETVSFQTPAIIVKKNQLLLSISTRDFSFITESNLSYLFGMFAYHKVKINTMQNSAMTFSCCIDDDEQKVNKLIDDLSKEYKVFYNHQLDLITIRHYNETVLKDVIADRLVLLEQRSRSTVQLVLK